MDTLYWTGFNHFVIWGSIIFFFAFNFVFYSDWIGYSYVGTARNLIGTSTFWFTTLLTAVILLLPILSYRLFLSETRPSLNDIVRLKQQMNNNTRNNHAVSCQHENRLNLSRASQRSRRSQRSQRSQSDKDSGFAFSGGGFAGLLYRGIIKSSGHRKKRENQELKTTPAVIAGKQQKRYANENSFSDENTPVQLKRVTLTDSLTDSLSQHSQIESAM